MMHETFIFHMDLEEAIQKAKNHFTMNKQEQQAFFDIFVQEQREILLKKGDDYAGDDRLSNFKRAGAICGLTAEQNCLSLIATKVARLGELLGGKEAKNESIKDSVLDLCNYGVLLGMLLSEKG